MLAGFELAAAGGFLSTLHPDNARVARRVRSVNTPPDWLFDPQTSGGLLAAVSARVADDVIAELQRRGQRHAKVIGDVLDSTETPLIECELQQPKS